MSGLKREKGFTLVELLVVIAILGVLAAMVSAAVSGTKKGSVEGQAKSDARGTQTALDNYNNKSIAPGQFPQVTPGTDATNLYHDVYEVATGVRAGGKPSGFQL